MATPAVADRYVTADFKHAPLIALADLMGLSSYEEEIVRNAEIYSPILSGIAIHRHLPRAQHSQVLYDIRHKVPPSHLQSKLDMLVGDQYAQPYWYMWSLSDEELKEFYAETSATAKVTDQFNPLGVPSLTVATVAVGVYRVANGGAVAAASNALSSLRKSELVMAVGRRLGLGPAVVQALGALALQALIVISGVNIMAKKNATRAKRELAARGLLAYEDL